MIFNEEVIKILRDHHIPKDTGLTYLLALYFNLDPDIDDEYKLKVHATRIVIFENGLQWNVPLFEGQQTAYDWVRKDYVQMFTDRNPKKRGNVNSAIERMKEFFVNNPDVTKTEVLRVSKIYIDSTDPMFIRESHNFISKGVGAEKISDLKDWIERLKEDENKNRTDSSVTMK